MKYSTAFSGKNSPARCTAELPVSCCEPTPKPAGLGNHVGHRERLTRPRRPKKGLISLATVYPLHQLLNRVGWSPFGEYQTVRS